MKPNRTSTRRGIMKRGGTRKRRHDEAKHLARSSSSTRRDDVHTFHVSGTGAKDLAGHGSWYAFAEIGTGVEGIRQEDCMTQYIAVYRAFLKVAKYAPPNCLINVCTAS